MTHTVIGTNDNADDDNDDDEDGVKIRNKGNNNK